MPKVTHRFNDIKSFVEYVNDFGIDIETLKPKGAETDLLEGNSVIDVLENTAFENYNIKNVIATGTDKQNNKVTFDIYVLSNKKENPKNLGYLQDKTDYNTEFLDINKKILNIQNDIEKLNVLVKVLHDRVETLETESVEYEDIDNEDTEEKETNKVGATEETNKLTFFEQLALKAVENQDIMRVITGIADKYLLKENKNNESNNT